MNTIAVDIVPGNRFKSGADIFLIDGNGARNQLAFDVEKIIRCRGSIDTLAFEFAYFCAIAYGCDRWVKREVAEGDRWTREFEVTIPVSDPDLWRNASPVAQALLEFLTGDLWHLVFTPLPSSILGTKFRRERSKFRKRSRMAGDAVSLFSGGLDSLIGTIDWLESNPDSNLVLASTYDAMAESAKADQTRLLEHLEKGYPKRYQYFVSRAGVCEKGLDTNFRSRSLAFIGNAVFAASFLQERTPIFIPENGAIALNFPLTPARAGSCSTRTVHPLFIKLLNKLLDNLGISNHIENPYKYMTKGQMVKQCINPAFLATACSDSVSCGKRGRDRVYWENKHAAGCGVCVPCIFRRAALFSAGYAEETYGRVIINRASLAPNSDLQAVIDFVESGHSPQGIWRLINGATRLSPKEKSDYIALVQTLRIEVGDWLKSVGLI
jgi:hypothetical protein